MEELKIDTLPKEPSEEALKIQKEIFMTSGGVKVGQSLREYKTERESLWEKMHPKKKEEVETIVSAQISDYQNTDQINEIKEKNEVERQDSLKKVRQELGLPSQENEKKDEGDLLEKFDELVQKKLDKIKLDKERERTYLALQKLFEEMRVRGSVSEIAKYILDEDYAQKRQADYPINLEYERAWDFATNDDSLKHKVENNWIYRGNMPSGDKKTLTRGSLNVTVTEEVVKNIDSLIKNGVIDANYKFGEPGMKSEASDRHDAITLYFLSEPSEEALKSLAEIADKNYRGDNLLGKKISKGFYMSDVGSVSDTHAIELVKVLDGINPEIAKVVKDFLTSKKGDKERTAMSEAQFYSVKEMLDLLNIKIDYKTETGFVVKK